MKKHVWKATMKKVLSCLLVVSFVVSMFAGIPSNVLAADVTLHDENGVPNIDGFNVNTSYPVSGTRKITSVDKGIDVYIGAGSEASMFRTNPSVTTKVEFKHGLRMEFSNFRAVKTGGGSVASEKYGLRVCLGNNGGNAKSAPDWGSKNSGYFVWYDASGSVAIYKKVKTDPNLQLVWSDQLVSLAELNNDDKAFVLEVKPIVTSAKNGDYDIYNWEIYINGNCVTTLEGVNATNGVFEAKQQCYVEGVSMQVLPDIATLFGATGNEERNGFGDNFAIGNKTYASQYGSTNKDFKRECDVTFTLSKFQIAEAPVGMPNIDEFNINTSYPVSGTRQITSVDKGIDVYIGAGSEASMFRTNPSVTTKVEFKHGLRMEFSNFRAVKTGGGSAASEKYGLRVCLGNNGGNAKSAPDWGSKNSGYFVWYDASGSVAIYKKVKTDPNLQLVWSDQLVSLAELNDDDKAFVLEVKPIVTSAKNGDYDIYNWEIYINGNCVTTLEGVNAANGVFEAKQQCYVEGVSVQVLPDIATLFGATGNEERNGFGDNFAIGNKTYASQYGSTNKDFKRECDVTFTLSKFQILALAPSNPNGAPESAGFGGATLEDVRDEFKVQQGVTATFKQSANQYIYTKNTYSFLNGFRFDLKDIQEKTATKGKDYSVAWAIGKAEDGKMWYGDEGYMFVYGYSGNFAIVKTVKDGTGLLSDNVVYQDTLASLKDVKELFFYIKETEGGKWSIYLSTYDANGNMPAHTAAATLDAVNTGDTKAYHIGFGAMGDFAPVENDKLEGLELTNTGSDISFGLYHMADSKPIENVRPKDLTGKEAGMGLPAGGNNIYFKEAENGVQVVVKKEAAKYERVNLAESFIPEDQMKLSLKEIATRNEDYTILVSIGDSKSPFYNTRGYSIACTKAGEVTIKRTREEGDRRSSGEGEGVKGPNFQNAILMCEGKLDQPINGELLISVKSKDGNLHISLNGKVFTVPVVPEDVDVADNGTKKWWSNTKNLYASVGIFSDKNYQVSYVVEKEAVEEFTGEFVKASELGLSYWTTQEYPLLFQKAEGGAKVISRVETMGYEKVAFKDQFMPADRMHIEITDITSKSDNYSLAVAIGDSKTPFYNTRGYMIIYGKSGDFSIVQTKQKSDLGLNSEPQLKHSTEVVYEKREPLGDSLTVDVKLKSGVYHITVNGKTYEVAAKAETHPMWTPTQLGASVAVLGEGRKDNIGIGLHKSYPVSFVLKVEEKEKITETGLSKAEMEKLGVSLVGENYILTNTPGGLKVINPVEAQGWERLVYKNRFSPTGNGMGVEITDITSKSDNYSLAVMLGESANPFYNTRGYMLIYGKSGNFTIIATDASAGTPKKSAVVVAEVREPLGDKLSVNVKIQADTYLVTVNGKVYEIPAQHSEYPISNPRMLYMALGAMGDGALEDISVGTFKSYSLSYVIKKTLGKVADGAEMPNEGEPFGFYVSGFHQYLSYAKQGVQVTRKANAASWERVTTIDQFETTEGGVQIELKDINSKDSNYSVAVMLGNKKDDWSDSTGYMLIYGKNGKFAIIATDSTVIDPNVSPIVFQEDREALGNALSINVRLTEDEEYKITVNGRTYTVEAEHKDYKLADIEKLNIGFGAYNNTEAGKWIVDSDWMKSPLTYTVASVHHTKEIVSGVEVNPTEEEDKTDKPASKPNNKPNSRPVVNEEPKAIPWVPIISVSAVIILVLALGGIVIYRKKIRRQ